MLCIILVACWTAELGSQLPRVETSIGKREVSSVWLNKAGLAQRLSAIVIGPWCRRVPLFENILLVNDSISVDWVYNICMSPGILGEGIERRLYT